MKTEQQQEERNQRKHVTGMVTSNKMEKTITVQIERLVKHPRYKKYVRRFTKLYAHDEKGEAHKGDLVEVVATRPLSKLKRWRLIRVVTKAKSDQTLDMAPEKVIAALTGKETK